MKILFIAPRFHTNQFPIIKNLAKKNQVNFLSYYKGEIENYKILKPTICRGFFISFLFNLKKLDFSEKAFFPDIFFLIKYLKKINPEVVIIRHQSKIFSYINILVLKILRKKIIIYDQNEITLKVKKNFLNHIWFYSEFLFRTYILNIPWCSPINNFKNKKILKNCFFLPFALEKNFRNKKRIKKKLKFLSIGKFRLRKNLLLLCKSVKFIKSNYNFDFSLTIIGQMKSIEERKYFLKIIKFIKKNKLQDVINIKTNIPHIKMSQFYKKADIFILPSTREPASISVLEAGSYGLPVILSDTSGTRCYFKNNFDAKFFYDQDQKDLEKKMIFFLKFPNQLNKYRKNLINNFDKNMSFANYENHFNEILQKL